MNPVLSKYYNQITQGRMIPHYNYSEFISMSNEVTGKSVQYRKGCTRRVKQAYVYLHEYLQNNN